MKHLLFFFLSFCVLQCNAQNRFFDKYDLILNGSYFINPYNDVNVKSFLTVDYLKINSKSNPSYDVGLTLKRKLPKSAITIGAGYIRLGLKTDLELGYPSPLPPELGNENGLWYEKHMNFDFNNSVLFNIGYEHNVGNKFRVGAKLHTVFLAKTRKKIVTANSEQGGGIVFSTTASGELLGTFEVNFRDKISTVNYGRNPFLLPELNVAYLISDNLALKASLFIKPWSKRNLYEANIEGLNTYEKETISSPPNNTYLKFNHTINHKFLFPSIGLEFNISERLKRKSSDKKKIN